MNLKQINEIRASAGLLALPQNPGKLAQAKRQAANKAARAELSRELKAKRNKGGK